MKIVFDNIVFGLQKSGGVSTLWYELLKRFEPFEKETYFLDYHEGNDNIYRKILNIPENNILNKNDRGNILKFRYTNPKLRNFDSPFIFHSSYYRYCKNNNAINVTIVHDFTFEYYMKGLAKFVHSYQKGNAIKNSDGIICISENTKNDLLKFYPKTPKEKIKVIYNGVSSDYFPIDKTKPIGIYDERFKKLEDKKNVIFIGHRTKYKNFDVAVKTFAKLDKSYHFVIIGEPLKEEEQELLDKYISRNNYTVFSKLENAKVNVLYNYGFALLYPSSFEGFGIPVIEAMKTGLPVILHSNSSLPEVGGNAGVYVENINENDFYEAIIQLLDDKYRTMVITKGFAQSSKFSWDITIEKYIAFYKELYDKRK